MPIVTGKPSASGPENIGQSSLLRATGQAKKVGFFTALLSRKVNKFIAKTIPEQVSSIDRDIKLLTQALQNPELSKEEGLIITSEITILEAKKELIKGVGELHTEIEGIIGEDRNLVLHYVAGFSDKKETWDAVDTIAYKVIQNQEKLPNFIAKFAYCVAKFVVKIALAGARKEGYKLSQEEMADVQTAVAKLLNTKASQGLDAAIDAFVDGKEDMNAKQKGILKKTIKDTITQVNETLGGQENPNMLVVSVAVKLLKATGDAGVKDVVLAQMPVLLKGVLASEFVKGKTDGLLDTVTPQELTALVKQGMDSSAEMLQDLVIDNPQLVSQDLDLSVDKVKQALKAVKQKLGGNIIAFIQAGDQKGMVRLLQKIGVFAAGELEAETKPVDKLFNILGPALAGIDNKKLATYIDITLKKHAPAELAKILEGKKVELDVLAPILGGSTEDIQAKKEMLDAVAEIVQVIGSEKASTEDLVSFVEKLLDQFEGSPDAQNNAIGSALAIHFDKAMVEHKGDITKFPAYLKAHKKDMVISTGREELKQEAQAATDGVKKAGHALKGGAEKVKELLFGKKKG